VFDSADVSRLLALLPRHVELEGRGNGWKSTHLHVPWDKQITFFTLVSPPCLVLCQCITTTSSPST
jgi:hypothetical protein